MTYEPIIKDSKLYGLSLNPYEKFTRKLGYSDIYDKWQEAESQRRLVEIDEYKIYQNDEIVVRGMSKHVTDLWHKLNLTDTFTADEQDGKLINLKVI